MSDAAKVLSWFWGFVLFHVSAFWWPHWAQEALWYFWALVAAVALVCAISFAVLEFTDIN